MLAVDIAACALRGASVTEVLL